MQSTEKPKLWVSAVIDFSPSEQLTGDPFRVITMGIAFGLYDLDAIERVGLNSDPEIEKYDLKKWVGKSLKYKNKALKHLQDLVKSNSISFAKCHIEEHAIRQIGTHHFNTLLQDEFGLSIDDLGAVSRSKSGRERLLVSIKEEGIERKILIDELLIMMWIAETFNRVIAKLEDVNGEPIGIKLYQDRFPLETDTKVPIKSEICATFLHKLCGDRISVVSNETRQKTHKDLLADNIAGLAAETFHNPDSEIALSVQNSSPRIFWMERKLVTLST